MAQVCWLVGGAWWERVQQRCACNVLTRRPFVPCRLLLHTTALHPQQQPRAGRNNKGAAPNKQQQQAPATAPPAAAPAAPAPAPNQGLAHTSGPVAASGAALLAARALQVCVRACVWGGRGGVLKLPLCSPNTPAQQPLQLTVQSMANHHHHSTRRAWRARAPTRRRHCGSFSMQRPRPMKSTQQQTCCGGRPSVTECEWR
jgi:hypothetical protein